METTPTFTLPLRNRPVELRLVKAKASMSPAGTLLPPSTALERLRIKLHIPHQR